MKRLAVLACLLTVCITASSALIRHWQAGLDCGAWAACAAVLPVRTNAGSADPGAATGDTAAGQAATDSRAGASAKTAAVSDPPPEAIRFARLAHRASASAVGLLVGLIALFGWLRFSAGQRVAAAIALVDTAFLAWLGRYTPHDLPLVTVGNVGGGILLAAALAWIAATPRIRARGARAAGLGFVPGPAASRKLRPVTGSRRAAGFALALMVLLVFSGAMISVRNAVPACPQWLCFDGAGLEAKAFDPRESGDAGKASALGMHLVHRGLALAFAATAVLALLRKWKAGAPADRLLAGTVALLLAAQIGLGLGTASGLAPLAAASLHNAVAALLAASLAAMAAGADGVGPAAPLRAGAGPDRFAGR